MAIIWDTIGPFGNLALVVDVGPPAVHLVGASPDAGGVELVPGLGGEDVVDVLDAIVAPDGVVNALPAEGLESVVDVGDGDPAARVEIGQEVLVGEGEMVEGPGLEVVGDLGVVGRGRVDDEEAAVEGAAGPGLRRSAGGLGPVRVGVLRGEGAILGDPGGRVVRLLEGVAGAGVAGGEDAGAGGIYGEGLCWDLGRCRVRGRSRSRIRDRRRGVQGQVHQLVHVAQDEHVRVEQDDAGKGRQVEDGQLGPGVEEARLVGKVARAAGLGGREERYVPGGDAAGGEGGASGRREGRRGQGQ